MSAMSCALNAREQKYSAEFAEKVINGIQMELLDEDDEVDKAVEIFRRVGETGHLLADAAHMGTDEIALGIALAEVRLSRCPPDAKRTNGHA